MLLIVSDLKPQTQRVVDLPISLNIWFGLGFKVISNVETIETMRSISSLKTESACDRFSSFPSFESATKRFSYLTIVLRDVHVLANKI